jgi:hypothetical protein
MTSLKIYIADDLAKEFRKLAMEIFGYGKGSISKAAEVAIQNWVLESKKILEEIEIPEDPVQAIKGLLKDVTETSVELQHMASKLRAQKA